MNSNDHQLQKPEPLTRFCPGCGSVGPVDNKYRDCCPDGNTARFVPAPFAKHCKGLFDLALQNVAAPTPEPVGFRCKNEDEQEDDWSWLPIRFLERNKSDSRVFELLYTQPAPAPEFVKEIERLLTENAEAKSIINELRVLIQNSLPVDKNAPIWEMVKEFQRKTK